MQSSLATQTPAERAPEGANLDRAGRLPGVIVFRNNMLPRSETFILAQARALRKFQPVFAAVHPSGASLIAKDEATFVTRSESTWGELARRWYWRTGFAPSFHRKLKALAPSLIHAHFAPDGVAALRLQDVLQVPLIVTLHGYDVTRNDEVLAQKPEGSLYLAQRHALWQRASAFICVSEFIKSRALSLGFPREKLIVLPIGIDLNLFRPCSLSREKDLILFVGRLVEKKGCGDLLAAVERIVSTHTAVRCVFIGDGPLRAQLEQQARDKKLPCEFLGMQNAQTVHEFLCRARVFCAPSKTAPDGDSEGLGMVFAEAQAVGTPVVSYRHGGIPEIVEHGETGLLASEGDVDGLAGALRLYLESDEMCRQHGSAGSARIKEIFCLERQSRKLEQFYLSHL